MKFIGILFFIFMFALSQSFAQFLIPGEGIMDVKIGADWDEVEWELGFKGHMSDKEDVSPEVQLIADNAGQDFDFAVSYQHIMWLPVTTLLFKEGKVCMIQLGSDAEYNQMLCENIGTMEGLNFWDNAAKIHEIYGNEKLESKTSDGITYKICKGRGIAVGLEEDEVRTMLIFQPSIE